MPRKLMLLLVLLSLAITANATKIQISEPECNPHDTSVYQLSGWSVTPTPTQEVFNFCNETGVNWTSLLMVIHTSLTSDQIICDTNAFEHCDITQVATGIVDALFYGAPNSQYYGGSGGDDDGEFEDDYRCPGEEHTMGTGVPNHCEFVVDMRCPNCLVGPDHWPTGTTADGYANVPEPSSAALMVSSIAVWLLRRKRSRI